MSAWRQDDHNDDGDDDGDDGDGYRELGGRGRQGMASNIIGREGGWEGRARAARKRRAKKRKLQK